MKKIKCKVCEKEFLPKKELRYTAKNTELNVFRFTPIEYDCFDCIKCGCQIVVGTRHSRIFPEYLSLDKNDYSNLPILKLSGGIEE